MNWAKIAMMRNTCFKEAGGEGKEEKKYWKTAACGAFTIYVGFTLHLNIETKAQKAY